MILYNSAGCYKRCISREAFQ